MMITII